MSYHFPALPTPAEQVRVDGWSPARQRQFLETLAATGIVARACAEAQISTRAAYALRIRGDGAAFRLGWTASGGCGGGAVPAPFPLSIRNG